MRTDVAVHTSAETLTAQSLLLLGRHAASPESSPHTSVHEWLQTAAPPPSPAESVSSSSFELQQAFASGAEAAMVVPPPARSSRMSRTSRRSVASSLAMEIFGYSRDMSGNLMHMAGQMQTQAEAQRLDAFAQRAEAQAQRAEVKQRDEAQRGEAMKRQKMLIQMKMVTDQTSTDREKAQIEANQKREQAWLKVKVDSDEATRKREQLLIGHELKRQKMLVDANTTLQQEKLKMDVNRKVANLEALERREAEFQHLQERERGRAREAQLKLRELAAQELKERVHLERELVKQQQQNLLLQKQRKIERLEAHVDRNLLSQAQVSASGQAPRGKLAQVPEEVETSSPETATVELTDSDSPPPPSQNRPKPVRRIPAVVNVDIQERPAPVSGIVVPKVVTPVVSPALGVATGVPLPSSEGPLIIPRGPEVVATPLPMANLVVGAQQVCPPARRFVVVCSAVYSATRAGASL